MTAFALRDANRNPTAAMNITPLVDVMLVLLVIFMLAVPMATQRLPLFNASACTGHCPPPPAPAHLSIKRTGELYWNGSAINRAQLAANLAGLARQAQPQSLEIRPEAGTRYGDVTTILAAARNADVERVSFAADR